MNYPLLILALIFISYIIWIIKYLEKKLPERDKRKEEEWHLKIKKTETKKNIEKKQEEEIQKIVKEEKKEIFIKNRKIRARKHYIDNYQKGKDYEIFVENYFKNLGYKTKPFGQKKGRKDEGIDIIIKKNKIITLIQCKNWKANGRKITHKELKEFLGNTTTFLEKRKNEAKGYKIKRMFITSNNILDNSAKYFLKETQILEYKVIPIEIDGQVRSNHLN